jgi:hypothetical protein
VDSGEECVCVGWEVDSGSVSLEIEDGADEGWVLMGETVVLLAGPGTGFDIVDAADRTVPLGFVGLMKYCRVSI